MTPSKRIMAEPLTASGAVDGMRPIHEVGSEENAYKYHRAKSYVAQPGNPSRMYIKKAYTALDHYITDRAMVKYPSIGTGGGNNAPSKHFQIIISTYS
jgi:hypothetical protein